MRSNENIESKLMDLLDEVYRIEAEKYYRKLEKVIAVVKDEFFREGKLEQQALLSLMRRLVPEGKETLALMLSMIILREARTQFEAEKSPKEELAKIVATYTGSDVTKDGTAQEGIRGSSLEEILKAAAVNDDEDDVLGADELPWVPLDGNSGINEWKSGNQSS